MLHKTRLPTMSQPEHLIFILSYSLTSVLKRFYRSVTFSKEPMFNVVHWNCVQRLYFYQLYERRSHLLNFIFTGCQDRRDQAKLKLQLTKALPFAIKDLVICSRKFLPYVFLDFESS